MQPTYHVMLCLYMLFSSAVDAWHAQSQEVLLALCATPARIFTNQNDL